MYSDVLIPWDFRTEVSYAFPPSALLERNVDLQENSTSLVYNMEWTKAEPDSLYKKLLLQLQ
jgi:hypothetical protein